MNEGHNGHCVMISSINDPVISNNQLSKDATLIFWNPSTGLGEML